MPQGSRCDLVSSALKPRWIQPCLLPLIEMALGLMLFCHSASAETADLPAPSQSPIKIGVSCVLTGPSSALGSNLCAGARAWFDRVNAEGGIHGHAIQLIVKDDQYEPDPAVLNTQDLIEKEHVLFLFNYVGTPTLTRVLPLLSYYRDENVVNVAPFTGAAPQRKPPYSAHVFNIRASYVDETRVLVHHFLAQGFTKIGFLGQADAYGKSGEAGVSAALKARGLEPVSIATYRRNQPSDTSMRAQVELLRSSGAEAVICVGVYGPCSTFIAECRRSGWEIPIANVSFVGSQSLLDRLRKLSAEESRDFTRNLINSQVVPPTNDERHPLVRDFNSVFGKGPDPSPVVFEGWLNAAVVTEALRRAGPNPTRVDFIAAMETLGGWDPGIGCPLGFSRTNHLGLSRVWLERTQRGHWVPELTELTRR